jgi:hypothetical protein
MWLVLLMVFGVQELTASLLHSSPGSKAGEHWSTLWVKARSGA